MASLLKTEDYPESVLPTPKIEEEIEASLIAFERSQFLLEGLGFTGMPLWNGSMQEFVNSFQARRH